MEKSTKTYLRFLESVLTELTATYEKGEYLKNDYERAKKEITKKIKEARDSLKSC